MSSSPVCNYLDDYGEYLPPINVDDFLGMPLKQTTINPNEVLKILTCFLCHELLIEPLTVENCGHSFCRVCLYNHFVDKFEKYCPKCYSHDNTQKVKYEIVPQIAKFNETLHQLSSTVFPVEFLNGIDKQRKIIAKEWLPHVPLWMHQQDELILFPHVTIKDLKITQPTDLIFFQSLMEDNKKQEQLIVVPIQKADFRRGPVFPGTIGILIKIISIQIDKAAQLVQQIEESEKAKNCKKKRRLIHIPTNPIIVSFSCISRIQIVDLISSRPDYENEKSLLPTFYRRYIHYSVFYRPMLDDIGTPPDQKLSPVTVHTIIKSLTIRTGDTLFEQYNIHLRLAKQPLPQTLEFWQHPSLGELMWWLVAILNEFDNINKTNFFNINKSFIYTLLQTQSLLERFKFLLLNKTFQVII